MVLYYDRNRPKQRENSEENKNEEIELHKSSYEFVTRETYIGYGRD